MAKKSKSIFRQPGVRKFQLVHRSQRDPLIHDPEASTHVFKPIRTGKGKAKADASLDESLGLGGDRTENFGEAALYGIYYDDSEYDYMQHLRAVGENKEDGVESIWIEAPAPTKKKEKSFLREDNDDDEYGDLPPEARPSKFELTQSQAQSAATEAIPYELSGLQPDMDPHLRQTLEALEDEAFVVAEVRGLPSNFDPRGVKPKAKEESAVVESTSTEPKEGEEGDEILDDADDFFAELVKDGERQDEEEAPWEFREEGYDEDEGENTSDVEEAGGDDEDWQARFKRFQLERKKGRANDEATGSDDDDFDGGRSEAQDTVGQLPRLPVIGGKRRRKGTSDASGYSMSSSSMFRNTGLTMLDERFDQVEKDYLSDEEDEEEEDEEAPELLNSSEHFNAIMDDFLDNYEILGRKILPVMPGQTPAEKLGTLRETMKDHTIPIKFDGILDESDDDSDDLFGEESDKADKWDCETVLSTYSNLENHPKIIRAASSRNVTKIILDPKTGLPSTASEGKTSKKSSKRALDKITEEESEPEQPRRVTVARSKHESKEEKKARKQAVKEERQVRRTTKKATQQEFANERKQQLRLQMDAPTKGVHRL